jgi:hypothetical protein
MGIKKEEDELQAFSKAGVNEVRWESHNLLQDQLQQILAIPQNKCNQCNQSWQGSTPKCAQMSNRKLFQLITQGMLTLSPEKFTHNQPPRT